MQEVIRFTGKTSVPEHFLIRVRISLRFGESLTPMTVRSGFDFIILSGDIPEPTEGTIPSPSNRPPIRHLELAAVCCCSDIGSPNGSCPRYVRPPVTLPVERRI